VCVASIKNEVTESQNGYSRVQTPSLYVLNAAALAKRHAIEHLDSDLNSYNSDIAVISETHFKAKHSDNVVKIKGYALCRKDRIGRKDGDVAFYVRSTLQSSTWTYS
jgi:hypothetical protein